MRSILLVITIASLWCGSIRHAAALDDSRAAIGVDASELLLGDGTGVVVGIIDSGVDDTHPGLTGVDSLGQTRLVAEANFVTSEPANTGDDVFGHGTAVAGVILGTEIPAGQVTIQGVASDARYVNARVLDNNNGFSTSSWVLNGVGYAIDQGADVLNLSLNFFAPNATGNSQLDQMLDWATGTGVHVAACAGNIGQGTGTTSVRGPGSLYNGFSVGRTGTNFNSVHPDSANAYTEDGRMKPDVVAPGTNIRTFNDDWETQADFTITSGCSFATPHTAGLLAQQIDYGRTQGLDTSPLVTKATLMNAATRVLDKSLQTWEPANSATNSGVLQVDAPLDTDSGAGQINGLALFDQYAAGEQEVGTVSRTGWDRALIQASQTMDYEIEAALPAGAELHTTLAWLRNVTRTDDGNGLVDANDTFNAEALDDLDLQLLLDGAVIAESISAVDNVEHLKWTTQVSGHYAIRVHGASVVGDLDEAFAVAWRTSELPGDFDQDQAFDCQDVDQLVAEIAGQTHNGLFDLTGDGLVTSADLDQWLITAGDLNLGATYLLGDANLDGVVDGQDFVAWNNAKFTLTPAWCSGDFNADGLVDGQDFVIWNNNKFSSAVDAVPEPGWFPLLFASGLLVRLRRRPG